jgi:hypothetical protein
MNAKSVSPSDPVFVKYCHTEGEKLYNMLRGPVQQGVGYLSPTSSLKHFANFLAGEEVTEGLSTIVPQEAHLIPTSMRETLRGFGTAAYAAGDMTTADCVSKLMAGKDREFTYRFDKKTGTLERI